MNWYFYAFLGLIGVLLALLLWALRKPPRRAGGFRGVRLPEECGSQHTAYLAQIQQALAKEDYEYISQRGSRELLRRFRKERRRMALAYLGGLHEDFENLLEVARIVAVLSPEVSALEEFEKLRLTWKFRRRFERVRLEIWLGQARLADMSSLTNVVSGLSVRMEKAIKELGERAALGSQLDSSLNRGGVHPV